MRNNFEHKDGVITGVCVFCASKISLSWFDWGQHLLNHTAEQRFYCIECNNDFATQLEHGSCSTDSIIDVFGDIGHSLDGFICKLCDHIQINDYRLLKHLDETHTDVCALFEYDVARMTLVPDIRPQDHVIHTGFAFVAANERYRCGIGNCIFRGKTLIEYAEHFRKAHNIVKTFICPHCKLLINRMSKTTVQHQEIIDHIESHGQNLFECDYCSQKMFAEADIRAHLTSKHSDMALKFWYNRRKLDAVDKCELIETILECSLCNERVDNTVSAYNHFKTVHPGHEIGFKVLKMIKSTTNDLRVTCSIHDPALYYQEVLACGLCDEYFLDKHGWFKHFLVKHPSQLLMAKRDFKWLKASAYTTVDGTKFDRGMLFFCASCEDSNGIKVECSTTIDGIYDHWKRTHTQSDFKPFRFNVTEFVACNYCDVICPYYDLREHNKHVHPNEAFIALKAFELQKKCAFCNYSDDNLIEHFEIKHNLAIEANVFNPIPLNGLILWKLLQICVYKKVKCEYCDVVFERMDEFRNHHSDEHPKSETMCRQFYDTESVRLIGDCCHSQIEPNSFFDHLAYHKYPLKCDECTFNASDPFDFMKHQAQCHNAADVIPSMYRKFMHTRYWRSELIFGNGLVLNKFNTQGTEFDYSSKFEKFVDALIQDKIQPSVKQPVRFFSPFN